MRLKDGTDEAIDILDKEVMAEYLNDFHKKNSERAKEYLRKQPMLSPEEMEAQTQRIHRQIAEREQKDKNNNMNKQSNQQEDFSKMPTPLPKEEVRRIMKASKERQMRARALEAEYMKNLLDNKKS